MKRLFALVIVIVFASPVALAQTKKTNRTATAKRHKKKGSAQRAKPPQAKAAAEITTPSGLKYVDLVVGTGASPQHGQMVTVHYTGTFTDGREFDSSVNSGQPFTFRIGVDPIIKGWVEGVMTMKVGGKRKLIIPPQLGYGERGAGGGVIPPNATLIFEIELLGVR